MGSFGFLFRRVEIKLYTTFMVKRSKKDMKEYGVICLLNILYRLKAKNVINYFLIYVRIMKVKLYTIINRNVSMQNFGSNNISLISISLDETMFFFARAEVISVLIDFLNIHVKIYIAQELQYYF
ncbi:hypothetical protein ACJX0J_015696 [Zea mays]